MTVRTSDQAATVLRAEDIATFRAAVSGSFVPLEVSTRHSGRFRALLRTAAFDDIQLTSVRAAEHVVRRTPELIARDARQFYKISVMVSGSGLLIQDNREAVLTPGDLAIYDTSRPYSLIFGGDFETLVLMVPRHLVTVPVLSDLTAVRISGATGPAALVAPFLHQVGAHLEDLSGVTGGRLAHSAIDLVSAVFLHEAGSAAQAPRRQLLRTIHDHIEARLASPDLGPSSIAAAHYISTRHLHGLFQQQGSTVSTWIRNRRLEHCRQDLADARLRERPVAVIAARWGFGDAAHFSRAFKAAYGVAPSEFRARH